MDSKGATREGISADDLFNTFVDMLSSKQTKEINGSESLYIIWSRYSIWL